MASLNTMVKKCAGLVGTKDVTPWEDQFLQSVLEKTSDGNNTTSLTEKQIDVLERINSGPVTLADFQVLTQKGAA